MVHISSGAHEQLWEELETIAAFGDGRAASRVLAAEAAAATAAAAAAPPPPLLSDSDSDAGSEAGEEPAVRHYTQPPRHDPEFVDATERTIDRLLAEGTIEAVEEQVYLSRQELEDSRTMFEDDDPWNHQDSRDSNRIGQRYLADDRAATAAALDPGAGTEPDF